MIFDAACGTSIKRYALKNKTEKPFSIICHKYVKIIF